MLASAFVIKIVENFYLLSIVLLIDGLDTLVLAGQHRRDISTLARQQVCADLRRNFDDIGVDTLCKSEAGLCY